MCQELQKDIQPRPDQTTTAHKTDKVRRRTWADVGTWKNSGTWEKPAPSSQE